MVPLASHFVDAVDVDRPQQMLFVHRQIVRLTVDLAGARKDDLDAGIIAPASFQDGQLGSTVDLQISTGILHRVHVAGLPCQVEQVILPLDQVPHAVLVPHIGDVDLHVVLETGDVEQVAAVFGDQAVHEGHAGTEVHQPSRQV